MELVFERRRGRTIIAHAYAEPPFCIRAFDVHDAAYVIVVCSGPGVFGGDSLHQSIRVGPGARAVLTSQSALQVHPARRLPAAVRHEYRLDDDAELHCHWDPVIPFAGASLTGRFDIEGEATARLYWSDAFMAGRLSRGESWRFDSVAHELRLRIGGALAYLERFRLAPADGAPTGPWLAADAGYFATTIVRHDRAEQQAAETLQRRFTEIESARVAVDAVEPGLLIARIAASSGACFAALRTAIRDAAHGSIFDGLAFPARK
jgi:urease accessory protein UreH